MSTILVGFLGKTPVSLLWWEVVVGVCWEDWRGSCGFEVGLDEGSDSVMRFAVRGHVTGFSVESTYENLHLIYIDLGNR